MARPTLNQTAPRIRAASLLAVLLLVAVSMGTAAHDATSSSVAAHARDQAGPSRLGAPPGPVALRPVSDLRGVLPASRRAVWNPGLNPVGGIPQRTKICTTIRPTGRDDTTAIQTALDHCPAYRVVKLTTGTFHISGEGLAITRSNITLRGSGWGTKLVKPAGSNYPVIIMGTRWYKYTKPVRFAANAVQGSNTATLTHNPGLQPGEIVTVDQLTDPTLTMWNPARSPPGDPSRGWFGEYDRPIGQVMEVDKVRGRTLTFTTPFHTAFLTARKAQLVRVADNSDGPPVPAVRYSGIEDLAVSRGEGGDGGGNIHLFATAYSWVKNVESAQSIGASVNLDGTFRSVLRDSYLHRTRDPNPGGGGYGIALDNYAADNLVENTISWNFNKVMVMRTTGGGNVIGYNYMEDGWGAGYPSIPEVGLNASHMTTPHYELFEGNESWNFDSDSVWGNSINITVFRNHLTGKRRSIPPLKLTDAINRRVIGLTRWSWWYTFIGNVLGTPGQSPAPLSSFTYESTPAHINDNNPVPMWKLGYNGETGGPQDRAVVARTIRNGNFDYVTKTVKWDRGFSHRLPPSLYLRAKPSFFGRLPWPWVTPDARRRYATLPARARFDRLLASRGRSHRSV